MFKGTKGRLLFRKLGYLLLRVGFRIAGGRFSIFGAITAELFDAERDILVITTSTRLNLNEIGVLKEQFLEAYEGRLKSSRIVVLNGGMMLSVLTPPHIEYKVVSNFVKQEELG